MVLFKPVRQKSSELDPREIAALRELSKQRAVEDYMLRRLEKLGLVKHASSVWDITEHGRIVLMFAAAR